MRDAGSATARPSRSIVSGPSMRTLDGRLAGPPSDYVRANLHVDASQLPRSPSHARGPHRSLRRHGIASRVPHRHARSGRCPDDSTRIPTPAPTARADIRHRGTCRTQPREGRRDGHDRSDRSSRPEIRSAARPRGGQGPPAGRLVVRRLRRHRHHPADRRRGALRGRSTSAPGRRCSTSPPATATPRSPPPAAGATWSPPTTCLRCSSAPASAPTPSGSPSSSARPTPRRCRSRTRASTWSSRRSG